MPPLHALLIFTGTGPLLLVSTFTEARDPRLVERLRHKGIDRFIAYEVALDAVQERYPEAYEPVTRELQGVEDVRVLDFNGHQIMSNFSLSDLGEPLRIG